MTPPPRQRDPDELLVYFPHAPADAIQSVLRAQSGPRVRFCFGAEQRNARRDDGEDMEFDVLVAGVPEREDIEASTRLRRLVIPWAGLPRKTRELMLQFPDVAVHNLHHNAAPTAELALALMFAAAKRIVPVDRSFRSTDWSSRYQDEQTDLLLAGRRAGVLGYGAVGRRVARACCALELEVTAWSRRGPRPDVADDPAIRHDAFPTDGLRDALGAVDVLFLTLPLTPDTDGLIDAKALRHLPVHAVLVNVARGPIVVEKDLYEALAERRIGAAGLDVWWKYPESNEDRMDTQPSEFPFRELDNVVMSPHRAGHSDGTAELRARHLVRTLADCAAGIEPPHRVDLQHGY